MADALTTPEQYRLKEFEKLRDEIEATLNAAWSNERYGVIACGAVWSWLISQKIPYPTLWALPLLIVVAGWGRNGGLYSHLFLMAEYMRTVERGFLGPQGGWDVYFDAKRNEKLIFYFRFVTDNIVWGALFLTALWGWVLHFYMRF
ncbi:MAG TPA: hypothetical protein VN658_02750 [Candidatus Acidoferrales bacterium]|nr:hypothetical protein [Candidatus Acidoferrales bacterium]